MVYVVEFRHRPAGLNKNRLRQRWSRWRFYSVLTLKVVALTRARNIEKRGINYVPGVYAGEELEARVVPFDRRRRRRE